MPKEKLRSVLVDHVMKDVSEEEKADASERWFNFLGILIRIVDREDLSEETMSSVSAKNRQNTVVAHAPL